MERRGLENLASASLDLAIEVQEHYQCHPDEPFVFKQSVTPEAGQEFLNLCQGKPCNMTIENACDIVSLIFCYNVPRSSTFFSAAFALTAGHVLENERLIELVRANLDKCTVDELSKIPIATLQRIIQFSELDRGKLFDLKFELAIGIYGRVGRAASVLFKGVKCWRLSVGQFGALRACQDFDESNLDDSLAGRVVKEFYRWKRPVECLRSRVQ
jgi:hypothetical protein